MKFLNFFKSFKNDESGAVTVDWVVLTAAVAGLGLAVASVVGTADLGTKITDAVDANIEE